MHPSLVYEEQASAKGRGDGLFQGKELMYFSGLRQFFALQCCRVDDFSAVAELTVL